MTNEQAARADGLDSGPAPSANPQPSCAPSDFGDVRERFASDLQNLAGHAQDLLTVTSAVSGESVAQAREQLRRTLSTAGDTIKRLQSEAVERGREMAKQTDSYVHENPWQGIAAGFVAGIALGLATSSLMRGTGQSSATSH